MHNKVEDFTALTGRQIVAAYNVANHLLGKDGESEVKKFKNNTEAVARLTKIRDELAAMHGYAQLTELEDGKFEWIVEKPQPPKAPVADPGAARVGATTLDLTQQLHLLKETNPKRPGSRAHGTFDVYFHLVNDTEAETVPTGADFVDAMVEAGYTRKLALSTLHWDIDHGFVRLGSTPQEEIAAPEEMTQEDPLPTTEEESAAIIKAESAGEE